MNNNALFFSLSRYIPSQMSQRIAGLSLVAAASLYPAVAFSALLVTDGAVL